MTSKYQDFSESLVVLGEPKCTSIFPTKGPHAGNLWNPDSCQVP